MFYAGRPRELCPHIIGHNRSGEEVAGWPGSSPARAPASCRNGAACALLHRRRPPAQGQPLARGAASHRAEQTCVSAIDLDINIHVRKRR